MMSCRVSAQPCVLEAQAVERQSRSVRYPRFKPGYSAFGHFLRQLRALSPLAKVSQLLLNLPVVRMSSLKKRRRGSPS